MIPNKIPVVVIRKYGLNIKVVINSFSLLVFAIDSLLINSYLYDSI